MFLFFNYSLQSVLVSDVQHGGLTYSLPYFCSFNQVMCLQNRMYMKGKI